MYLHTLMSLLTLITPSISLIEEQTTCPDGFGLLNGECVKRFTPPKRKKCTEPLLKFGQFELQLDGRVVDYWCEEGWTLTPEDFASAVCKLGHWSKPQPQCVRPGCQDIQPPQHGGFNYSLGGALVTFRCNSDDLTISGESVLGCDGQFWNASVPTCVLKQQNWTSVGSSFKINWWIICSKSFMHYYYSSSRHNWTFHVFK